MARRKVSKATYEQKINRVRGEFLSAFTTLEWGITVVTCEHLSPNAYNPIIYILNNTGTNIRIKLYEEIINHNKYLSAEEAKQITKWLEHLYKIRNLFCHAMIILPELNDYKDCDYFEFHTIGKLFESKSKTLRYSEKDYNSDLDKIESLIDFNDIFVERMEEEIRAEEMKN